MSVERLPNTANVIVAIINYSDTKFSATNLSDYLPSGQAAASGYRYRPASDHVTMQRDSHSTKLECRSDPRSE